MFDRVLNTSLEAAISYLRDRCQILLLKLEMISPRTLEAKLGEDPFFRFSNNFNGNRS